MAYAASHDDGCQMKTWDNDLNFNMKWWKLDLDVDSRWHKYRRLGMSGMTVVGTSTTEMVRIKEWAAKNQLYKMTRMQTFEDVLEKKWFGKINNQGGIRKFEYIENEVCVFDGYDKLLEFELFLVSMPKRSMETFVVGRELSEVKKICRAINHRLLLDISDGSRVAASVSDKDVFLQLNLISSEEQP